jgi:hypothetical protein
MITAGIGRFGTYWTRPDYWYYFGKACSLFVMSYCFCHLLANTIPISMLLLRLTYFHCTNGKARSRYLQLFYTVWPICSSVFVRLRLSQAFEILCPGFPLSLATLTRKQRKRTMTGLQIASSSHLAA